LTFRAFLPFSLYFLKKEAKKGVFIATFPIQFITIPIAFVKKPYFLVKSVGFSHFKRKKVGNCSKTPFSKSKKSGFSNRRKKVRKKRPCFMEEKQEILYVFFGRNSFCQKRQKRGLFCKKQKKKAKK
jgi:hypothetical protein